MNDSTQTTYRSRTSTLAGPLLLTLTALALGGCASTGGLPDRSRPTAAEPAPRPPAPDAVGAGVVDAALAMLGVPYRYGGDTPRGFDCSGLVQYAFAQTGLRVPRTTAAQHAAAEPVGWSDARPGDLLFFKDGRKVSHVAIYLGNGEFVHAPTAGRSVERRTLEHRYYREHFVGIGRLRPPL